jgi:hypothetical protein
LRYEHLCLQLCLVFSLGHLLHPLLQLHLPKGIYMDNNIRNDDCSAAQETLICTCLSTDMTPLAGQNCHHGDSGNGHVVPKTIAYNASCNGRPVSNKSFVVLIVTIR